MSQPQKMDLIDSPLLGDAQHRLTYFSPLFLPMAIRINRLYRLVTVQKPTENTRTGMLCILRAPFRPFYIMTTTIIHRFIDIPANNRYYSNEIYTKESKYCFLLFYLLPSRLHTDRVVQHKAERS